jgi:hypothetical protein
VSDVSTWVTSTPRAAADSTTPERPERGPVARAVSAGFWGAGLSVTVAALAVPGLIVLLLLPLLGFWYLVFCAIAARGESAELDATKART